MLITVFTTIDKDADPKSVDYSKAFLWCAEAEDAARENAADGGHKLVRLTLVAVNVKEVDQ